MNEYKMPTVAIIGRPNVGKSTLFNALVGERRAIVSPIAGTTRDSLMEKIDNLGKIPYWIVDTAGLTDFTENDLEKEIQIQVEVSLQNADMILWIVDGRTELTQDDLEIARKLRSEGHKILFCANKIDDGNEQNVYQLTELGFGIPHTVSAKNNFGFWDLTEVIQEKLVELGFEAPEKKKEAENSEEIEVNTGPIKVALIGRPNVGKSTLFNQLIEEKRSVVSNVAGTTRDSIDTEFTDEEGQEYIFIDTAGVRKRGKIEKNFEFWSYVRTNQSIERADVCILLIDALDGVTHQDLVLAGKAVEAGKGIIIGVNKFDLSIEKSRAKEETDERELEEVPMWDEEVSNIRDKYLHYLSRKIKFLSWAPVLFFSGKTGKGVKDIFTSIKGCAKERTRRVPTGALNLFVKDIYYDHVAPSQGTKLGKLKYASQVAIDPPKFIFFVNNKDAFHFSYIRYIENKLRKKYGFMGTPLQIELRDSMGNRRSRRREDGEDEKKK